MTGPDFAFFLEEGSTPLIEAFGGGVSGGKDCWVSRNKEPELGTALYTTLEEKAINPIMKPFQGTATKRSLFCRCHTSVGWYPVFFKRNIFDIRVLIPKY
jgi:hypothetical protein